MTIDLIIDIDDERLDRSKLSRTWFPIFDTPVIPLDGSIFECDWDVYCMEDLAEAMNLLSEDMCMWTIHITGYKFIVGSVIVNLDLRPAK